MVLNTCLFLAGLVWIASVIVGSPMLFVQQLKVSALQKTHKIAFFSLKKVHILGNPSEHNRWKDMLALS